jgi:hypothetical protein
MTSYLTQLSKSRSFFKAVFKASLKSSLKPKEIIDLGTILLGSYRLPPPSPLEPSSSELSLSPPLIIWYMTPAQLLAEL